MSETLSWSEILARIERVEKKLAKLESDTPEKAGDKELVQTRKDCGRDPLKFAKRITKPTPTEQKTEAVPSFKKIVQLMRESRDVEDFLDKLDEIQAEEGTRTEAFTLKKLADLASECENLGELVERLKEIPSTEKITEALT